MLESILIAARLGYSATLKVYNVSPYTASTCCTPCPGIIYASPSNVVEFTCSGYADKILVVDASGVESFFLRKIAIFGTKGCQTTIAAIPELFAIAGQTPTTYDFSYQTECGDA